MKDLSKDRINYLKFEKGQQTKFLRIVKNKCFNSWDDLANYLGVNRSMVFFYLSEKSKFSYFNFNKLIKISKLNPNDFSFEIIQLYDKVKIPEKYTPELAEFLGIMLGDGCVYRVNSQITISCGEIDRPYILEYIPDLVEKLFSKKVSFRKMTEGGLDCRFASREVCCYLSNEFDFKSPRGECEIPPKFFMNNNLLRACIRGLFDTDGGLHRHHKNSAQLSFTNKSRNLIKSLALALEKLGYNPRITINHKRRNILTLYLFSYDVKKYFEEIGSSNLKNQIKFEKWIKEGIVPLNRELVLR